MKKINSFIAFLVCSLAFSHVAATEYIDHHTQSRIFNPSDSHVNGLFIHVCVQGVMSGLRADKNQLLCDASPVTGHVAFETSSGAAFDDFYTQRAGMHACPAGTVMAGFHKANNVLRCYRTNLYDFSKELTDTGTQRSGMHACPVGYAMTGVNLARNDFLCVPEK